MSTTERLRELLDERGVKWTEWKDPYTTAWLDGSHGVRAEEYDDQLLVERVMTPEQAIDATLGRETCHYEPDYMGFTWWDENDVEHYEENSANDECSSASCDKCGYTMMVGEGGWFDGWDEITEWTEEDGSEHKGCILKPRFKFCPNCGKAVGS